MTPEEELLWADRLEDQARRLQERSRMASWIGASLVLRFRALWAEEAAVRLRRKAGRGRR
jgi:hypothetical protein